IAPPTNPVPAALISEVLVMASSYAATMHHSCSVVKYIVIDISRPTTKRQNPSNGPCLSGYLTSALLRGISHGGGICHALRYQEGYLFSLQMGRTRKICHRDCRIFRVVENGDFCRDRIIGGNCELA